VIDNQKIKSNHRHRAAVVYIRQSHPSQMENHPESTARQYALVEKAIGLGWNRNQVITIDEDLGISGQVFVKRSGFEHLNAEVALGRVGILLGLEVSRLARSNADWYRLLDMCAITDTLLADNDGLYHLGLFNDRLILGLEIEAKFVARQIEVCASDIGCDAVKTGMLANAEIIDLVAAEISTRRLGSLVVDPVMIAKSGVRLLKPDAIEALKTKLLPLAAVVTPTCMKRERSRGAKSILLRK
jgi:hypothetical protein